MDLQGIWPGQCQGAVSLSFADSMEKRRLWTAPVIAVARHGADVPAALRRGDPG